MPLAPEWQHPFVNVFKICDVDTLKEFETKGDVTEHMDKIIGKKVFKIRGVIPAGNYLRVPRSKLQSLGLTGRILYIQLKVTPVKVFVIHIEAVTEDRNIHRVSISNMYSLEAPKRKSNGVQLAFPRPSHRWCVLAVDMRAALRGFTSSPFSHIKSIQMCSWLTVRTMFTSDYRFSLESLPSDMALSHALDTGIFEMVWLPQEARDAPTMDFLPPPKRIGLRRRVTNLSGGVCPSAESTRSNFARNKHTAAAKNVTQRGSRGNPHRHDNDAAGGHDQVRVTNLTCDDDDDDDDEGTPLPPSPIVRPPLPPLPTLSPRARMAAANHTTAANVSGPVAAVTVTNVAAVPARPGDPSRNGFPRRTPAVPTTVATTADVDAARRNAAACAIARLGTDSVVQGPPMLPDPALELVRLNAYSGEFVRCLVWIPGSDEVAYAAASVVVMMRVDDAPSAGAAPGAAQQRYLLGHTAYVCALAVSTNGEVLASAQEGKDAVVRLWDAGSCACLAILNAHASGLSCVDISPDGRALAAVGLDSHARQTIALWNVSELRGPLRKIELVTRQATEFNIKVLRFSAYQEDHLLTAGRDSIRIYRLKAGQLRGTSVRLVPQEKRVTSHISGVSPALGPNIFTDIAFEAGVGVYGVDAFKVYVSSASGAVFQVDYTTRRLDAVYQLHTAPINCLVVTDGLALTGSDDRLLRAWPLDFKDYLLEAEHEGGVTGLALSPDALRVAIGTESGALGCLAIPNHSYTTLLRSHAGAVNAVAVDPNRDEFCTVSSDGTLRIWHLTTHQQLYEFDAPGEAVTCIAYHPLPTHHELAAGFATGRMRVFDVGATTLIQEQQQHRAAVAELVFSPGGDRLFSGGMDGALVMYDVTRLYAPSQYLSAGVRDIKVCVAVSPNGALFASVVRDPYRSVTSLLLFHGRTLDPYMRIETDAAAYVKLAFSPDSSELWALTSCRRMDRYELRDGQLVQQIFEVSALDVTTLAVDPVGRYLVTAGADGLLRLWSRLPLAALQPRGLPPHQAFLGHPSTVLGAAFHRGHLITVGDADCVGVWRVVADTGRPYRPPLPARPFTPLLPPSPSSRRPETVLLMPGTHLSSPPHLDPHHPLSRASPGTSLGPVAHASDHVLTARAAALTSPNGAINSGVESYATRAGAFHAVAEALAATHISTPTGPTLIPAPQPPPPAAAAPTAAYLSTPRPMFSVSAPTEHHPHLTSSLGSPRSPSSPARSPTQSPNSRHVAWANSPSAPGRSSPVVSHAPSSPSQPHSPHRLHLQQPVPISHPQHQQYQQPLKQQQQQRALERLSVGGPVPIPACSWLLGYSSTGCCNVAWRPETGLFAYSVDDMVVLEHLATRRQRYLRGHSQPLACLAASVDGAYVAAGPMLPEPYDVPSSGPHAVLAVPCATAPFADVVVWDVAIGQERWRMRYHTHGVQALSFSPDGRWLLSLGREPERSVVLWDVVSGQLVAAGRTEHQPLGADWLWGGDRPAFASVGPDGLLLWTLQESFLEQRCVPLGDRDTTTPCTAVVVDSSSGALLVAETPMPLPYGDSGAVHAAVWHVEVAGALNGGTASMVQVASVPGGAAVTVINVGQHHAMLATDQGHVLRFRRTTLSGTWSEDGVVRLDGRVTGLCAEPGMRDAVVATSTATIWFVGMEDASSVPIVCGQPSDVQALIPAPHTPRVMASTSQDGLLRVWHLGPEDAEPVVELRSTSPCTAAAFLPPSAHTPPPVAPAAPAPDPSSEPASQRPPSSSHTALLLGGYADGSLRLFGLEPTVGLRWALARHPVPVIAVTPHPTRSLALTASSDGSLAITDLNSTRLVSYVTALTAMGPISPSSAAKRRSPRGNSPAQVSPQPEHPRPGSGPMQAFAVSPGLGASVAAAGWRDRFVVFATPWDDPSCTPISSYDCQTRVDVQQSPVDELVRAPSDVPAQLAFVGGATKHLSYTSPVLMGAVLIYDYRLGFVVRRVAVPQMVHSMSLSPDGGALVLGCMQRTVYLVNLASGLYEGFSGHTSPVAAVAFSGDGSHVVTAAGNVMMVWEATEVLRKLEPPPPLPPRRTLFEY